MDTEASPFESSEMLASFVASSPLLSTSWRLCELACETSPASYLFQKIGDISYIAFSSVQLLQEQDSVSQSFGNLEPLPGFFHGIFSPLCNQTEDEDEEESEEPVMIHSGLLRVFLYFYSDRRFFTQMSEIMQSSKSIIITGHSTGGTIASLCALWLLSCLQSTSSTLSVLCVTFGSPLLGNQSLSNAILRQRWGGNFCHVVSKHDIVPRLLFAPLSLLTPQQRSLLQFWQTCLISPHFGSLDESKAEIFRIVLASLEDLARANSGSKINCCFWPFGNYFFCSEDGAICIDKATCVVKMMHLLFATSSPSSSIEDHLKYRYYIEKVSFLFLNKRGSVSEELPESSYEAGVALAVQSSGIACQELVAQIAKDCLKLARPMGRPPNLNCANLAIKLSKVTPYRAEIQWYKATCDVSDDQMGYYDSFKHRAASKRDSKVNMNRHKLGQFWDYVIKMLENNQLPHDFHRRAKWVNASQFYMLLVEPLDIAEYYRTGMHLIKGHYITNGREKRHKIFDKWWRERPVKDKEQSARSKFASLTQDTCFWARVEEAREWLDKIRSEKDTTNLALLWQKIDGFATYAGELVERKEVSKDVVARNSSYSAWVKDYNQLKSHVAQLPSQFLSIIGGKVS